MAQLVRPTRAPERRLLRRNDETQGTLPVLREGEGPAHGVLRGGVRRHQNAAGHARARAAAPTGSSPHGDTPRAQGKPQRGYNLLHHAFICASNASYTSAGIAVSKARSSARDLRALRRHSGLRQTIRAAAGLLAGGVEDDLALGAS